LIDSIDPEIAKAKAAGAIVETATLIVRDLNGILLAIEQAGALLKNGCSIFGFRDEYQTHYILLMNKYPTRGLLWYEKERSIITVFDMLYHSI
jgi:hypothetical protein